MPFPLLKKNINALGALEFDYQLTHMVPPTEKISLKNKKKIDRKDEFVLQIFDLL